VKVADGYHGYGYIFAGIEAPLTEARGKLILIVDNSQANSLSNELVRLESDLTGDGWTVVRHDVSRTDSPVSIRNLIINDYNADPMNVNTVLLFGHIPIFYSGNLNYDGHLSRPMPADAFYGDVVGNWNTNLNFLPADVCLMVGRVDMADMPGQFAPVPWPAEVELLRNYLNKDHAWRHKLVDVPRRALIGDRRGDEGGEGTASTGFRNFEPMVGPGNIIEADIADVSAPEVRWGPMLAADSYLWAYGCGGGMPTGISHLGTNGQYNDLYSTDVVGQDAKAVFVMLFGSWFGNWDGTDNFLRAFLATPSLGLTCCMAGRPHWFVHHMGLGETIGYGARLSMNNSTLYQSQTNFFMRAIYIALMGDPALRMDRVSPPAALNATAGASGVNLSWTASAENVPGYHVYRRSSAAGPFTRLTGSLLSSTNFTDTNVLSGMSTYLVRSVKLQTTPSGTYFNASQGVFVNVSEPIRVLAHLATNSLVLNWNAQPGTVYHVQAKDGVTLTNWTDMSD
ncbi:MAG TPA: fibronectin type III domain-containing protein, partial [Candidatus Binatia bacterium]|nr:fibronectin type III domain-containing protein [Candidatus Binatia bacterium]